MSNTVTSVNRSKILYFKAPEKQLVDYVRDAGLGLLYLHSKGLIHFDVKPTNILVSAILKNKQDLQIIF